MSRLICPACAQRTSSWIGGRDGLDVFWCDAPDCRLMWRTPVLGHVKLGGDRVGDRYREAGYHEDHCRESNLPTFVERFEHDLGVALLRLSALHKLVHVDEGLRMLDVGCGNGAFVTAALDAGADAFGFDPGRPIIEWANAREARSRRPSRFMVADAPPDAGRPFDVVTAFDVLEHVPDPYAYLVRIAAVTADAGFVIIEAPDPACEDAERSGLEFRHAKPREHVYLLSGTTWCDMLEAAGFSPVSLSVPVPTKLRVVGRKLAHPAPRTGSSRLYDLL